MREIKFRAWDTLNKRIIHDYFFIDSDGCVWYDQDPHGVDISGKKKILQTNKLILLQFTGLKDKNGKEIYEGDIVMWHGGGAGNENKVGDVYYDDARFHVRNYLLGFLDYPTDAFGEGLHTIRVIGNIYENHELIKQL